MSFFLYDFDCHGLFVLQSYTFDYFAERTLSQNGLHQIIGLFREDDASISEVLVLCTSLWRHITNVLEPDVFEERRQKEKGTVLATLATICYLALRAYVISIYSFGVNQTQ